MANLGNITTPNPQNLPFDTNRDDKPLAKASKVRMDDPVPGSTDNDAESWRTRHEGRNDVAERQISSLQNRAADLHAPPPASGWADALSNNSEGGLAVRAGAWNLAQARAATYAVSLDQNLEGRTAVVRVRAGADPRQVRVQLQGDPGMIFNDLLTNFHLLGGSADAVWDYYWDDDELGDLSLIVLQVTGSAAHIGQSVYKGKFDGEFSSRVLAELASPQPDGHLDARVGVLEDKSSRIGFDEKGTTWAPVANTAVEGRHPYGQWAWIADGNDPDSYPGLDYESDFTATAGAGFAGGGSGLLWVLPNNINWSKCSAGGDLG